MQEILIASLSAFNCLLTVTYCAGSISNFFVTLSIRNESSAADNELKTKKVKL